MTDEQRFADVVDTFLGRPGVEEGSGFGKSPTLCVNGKIFAMLIEGRVVLKLQAHRCQELRHAGEAAALERGRGRPLREWVVLTGCGDRTIGLATEAFHFVRAAGKPDDGTVD